MEKPTCRTCPYWDFDEGVFADEDPDVVSTYCKRLPPVLPSAAFVAACVQVSTASEASVFRGEWPMVKGAEWCGEHPDFPAWITSRLG